MFAVSSRCPTLIFSSSQLVGSSRTVMEANGHLLRILARSFASGEGAISLSAVVAISRNDGFEDFTHPTALQQKSPSMSSDKVVYMANQTGKCFASQGDDQAVAGIADHLQKYRDPSIRSTIVDHLDHGGHGLEPLVRQAVEGFKEGPSKR
jgi:formate dehydrogenase subunit delta